MMDFLHDSSFAQSVSRFAVVFIPAYLGIILHEVGHGWAALREGDPTAKFMGRLTINPLPHIDVLGLVVFIITSISGGFVFGWAKPVPIDPRNFRNPRRGLLTVSLAGPGTNIILAVLFACLLKILLLIDPSIVLMATPTETFGCARFSPESQSTSASLSLICSLSRLWTEARCWPTFSLRATRIPIFPLSATVFSFSCCSS